VLDTYRDKGLRKALVEELRKKGIEDEKVLEAIGKVPRHFFFEETFRNQAYKDIAFQIGEGQTISQPYTVAYQTNCCIFIRTIKCWKLVQAAVTRPVY